MMPYESVILVLMLAMLSTLNAFYKNSRWLSFVCLSFAVVGITGLVEVNAAYDLYFVFGPSSLILFVAAALFARPFQRLALATLASALFLGMVYVRQAPDDIYINSMYLLGLYGGSMLFPALLGAVAGQDEDRVERLISIQQLWVRLMFLAWCRENMVNINHYEFIAEATVPLTAGAAVILLLGIAVRPRAWFFASKSFLSLALMLGGLSVDQPGLRLLLVWTLVLGIVDLLPQMRDQKLQGLVRRFALGAFGGGAFFGLLFITEHARVDGTWKLGWMAMVFGLGFLASVLPGQPKSDENGGRALPAIGLGLQAIFFALVFFWPDLKGMGG
ncbi:MAG TPA: hypothetical protein VFV50_19370 [Bdellovibrionales bacterium]|nr:hypothetical protein [Bdellovibrionales bacterium]